MAQSTTPTLTFHVDSVEWASQPGAYSLYLDRQVLPAREGWDARVTVFADGREIGSLHLDRIDGEDAWHVSAEFRAGCSMPRFMNGLFSRCTIPTLAGPELTAVLDEAAANTPVEG